jgi:hypothetical protein
MPARGCDRTAPTIKASRGYPTRVVANHVGGKVVVQKCAATIAVLHTAP